jgi:hypothetical protein
MEKIKNPLSEEELKAEALVIYDEIIKEPEISEALGLLDKLPKNLKYHNKEHTLDVLKETILFALADGRDRETIRQQAISAAWHDVGFVKQHAQNEPVAVEMFKQSKTFQTLSEEQRNEIIANILDTQIVMKDDKPFLLQQRSRLGYVLDGDVSNFGREDFSEKRMRVAEELGLNLSNADIKRKFCKFVIELLRNHEWKTASARALRQAQKEINLRRAVEEYDRI